MPNERLARLTLAHHGTTPSLLIALGRTMAVFPASARTWLWSARSATQL